MTRSWADKRIRLAGLLDEAAQCEHNLLCQYLFAAFSMKRHPDEGGVTWAQLEAMRRWEASILLVARQEMEHLGLVSNLLTAIGEAPNFRRADFPISGRNSGLNIPSPLQKFGRESIWRFARYEWPVRMNPESRALLNSVKQTLGDLPDGPAMHKPDGPFPHTGFDSVAELYDEIRNLFRELARKIGPDAIFIGPKEAQVTTGDLLGEAMPSRVRVYDMMSQPVTGMVSAMETIEQIVDEGEGCARHHMEGHWEKFITVFQELVEEEKRDPTFSPARHVVENPRTVYQEGGAYDSGIRGVQSIRNPLTNQVSELFDLAYETMLMCLKRFFSRVDENSVQISGLQQVVFFPIMTCIIRPLGEVLTQLPMHDDPALGYAGPSFAFSRRVSLLPHQESAWKVIAFQLAFMTERADELRRHIAFSSDIRARLTGVYENTARMEQTFREVMGLGGAK